MKRHVFPIICLMAAAGVLLSGCNLSAASPPTPVDPGPAYTAAAQTIIADLTEAAGTLPATQPGGGTPGATRPPGNTPTPAPTDRATDTPTASPTSSPTASATPPPSPTASPPSSDPRSYLGAPSFTDSFVSDANWTPYDDGHVAFEVEDEQMVMTAFNPDSWEGWMISWPVISDFYLEMTASVTACAGGDRYGMLARAEKSDQDYLGYMFSITCDGRYSLRRWNGENFDTMLDWTGSEHIRAGANQANRIGLMAVGKKLSLYVNGNLVREISDDTHLSGRYGLSVGSAKTPDFTVLVDEIAYWELP